MNNRPFPIIQGSAERFDPSGAPESIPWGLLEPHEAQAVRNHSQSLRRLAERGGLSTCEAIAVIEDRRWCKMERKDAAEKLNDMVADWKRLQKKPPGLLEQGAVRLLSIFLRRKK